MRKTKAADTEGLALRRAILELGAKRAKPHPLALPGQPFDSFLLRESPLFRRSRERFLSGGGVFEAALVSSPRSLSSPILLENRTEYSPIEKELVWSATDPRQKGDLSHLKRLRSYSTSLFHEQNHRVLWQRLPRAPQDAASLRRYLNFAESLVIATDMALGDLLGPRLSRSLWLCGVAYDPGTDVRKQARDRRAYRNYLHACAYATYLNLELYDPKDIPKAVHALFPALGALADRATRRAGNLDRMFIANTNLFWQRKNRGAILKALSTPGEETLELPSNPMDNRLQYLLAEQWFAEMGL